MKETWKRSALLATLLVAATAGGCAQDIGDIDRTEPNKIKKSDLTEGSWYMTQKVTSVGSVAGDSIFEGLHMDTDKVVFVAEENYLIAYRSYSDLPGSEGSSLNYYGDGSYEELYDSDFKGTVKAMYPIRSHFDVQRMYDTATGEQSNVIIENASDRNWWERDYIRVDWTGNPLINFEWRWAWGLPSISLGYNHADIVSEDGSDPAAPYFERDAEGQLVYFDTPTNYILQPDLYSCLGGVFLGWWFGTCGSSEVRVVTSFARDLGVKDYEPVAYTNQDMSRFGMFRVERYVYDPQNGILNDARLQYATLHNIWADTYDEKGEIKAISERHIKTEPYYIRNLEDDKYIQEAAVSVINEWDKLFRKAVLAIQGNATKPTDLWDDENYERLVAENNLPHVFVPCHIPVAAGDNHEVCGPEGYSPREADPRKNVLWIISQRQDAGLYGICQSYTDPTNGKNLASAAHVYTSPMARGANSAVTILRYLNGDLTDDDILSNQYAIEAAKNNSGQLFNIEQKGQIAQTKHIDKANKQKRKALDKKANRDAKLARLMPFNHESADAKLKGMYTNGLFNGIDEKSYKNGIKRLLGDKTAGQLNDEEKELLSTFSANSFVARKHREDAMKTMGAMGICPAESAYDFDYKYAAIAREYLGRTDYDDVLREIRSRLFTSTALHEMGHGFALRHNFSGSFDSLNFNDRYWELRPDKNWNKDITNPNEMLQIYQLSDKQLGRSFSDSTDETEKQIGYEEAVKGGLMSNMYTSIMDYSSGDVADFKGFGRYDLAAIIYAYSKGTDYVEESEDLCIAHKGTYDASKGKCKRVVSGLVEVFDKHLDDLGVFGQVISQPDTTGAVSAKVLVENGNKIYEHTLMSTFDDATTIGQPYSELVHPHDVLRAYPNNNLGNGVPAFITERSYARLEDYQTSRVTDGNKAMVRVPYLFCSDENAGALASCNRWDMGVDSFEIMMDYINEYDNYYWLTSYARGRAFWEAYSASSRKLFYFTRMSDLFQNWYVSDRKSLDAIIEDNNMDLIDHVSEAANYAALNTLAKVVVTPEYGLYCKRKDDNTLFPLSSDDEAQAETSEFYRRAICGKDPEYFYIKPGDGHRRYQKYDVNIGYDYSNYEYEEEHNYTSAFAAMALLDNEAYVIADGGDMGTYTFGMYDYFTEEVTKLINGMLGEDYKSISPVLDLSDNEITTANGEQVKTGKLIYKPLGFATWYPKEGAPYYYDPLSGKSEDDFEELEDAKYPVVETQTSLTQKFYMGAYSMLLTAIGNDSQFYDQLNVWLDGSGESIKPGNGFETISFESPFSGEIYSANYIDCSKADLANMPPVCLREGSNYISKTGGYLMVDFANKQMNKMTKAYDDYITKAIAIGDADEDSDEYQDMLNSYYEYRMYEYQTEYALRDINFMRGFHAYFGTLF